MSGPAGGTDPSSTFRLPASLTLAGRRAFDGAVQDYVRQLSQQLNCNAHRQHRRPDSVYTTDDVLAAKLAYEQRIREQEQELVDIRGVAIILLLIAAGIGVLTTYATGFAQAALLGLFVAMETAGVLLIWRSRPRPPRPDG